jgi:hypothetical protein
VINWKRLPIPREGGSKELSTGVTSPAAHFTRREAARKRTPQGAHRRAVDPTAWISKYRRCVRDYETLPEHHEAMVHIAMIMTMSRRLARTGDW